MTELALTPMRRDGLIVEAMLSAHPEMNAQDAICDTALSKCGRKYNISGNGDIFSSILSALRRSESGH